MSYNQSSSYQLDFQKIRKKTQINDINSLELYLLNIFNDLSRRDNSEKEEKSIEKITFVEYMNIPYIVGEKLFNVFDSNKNGFLNQTEFVSGIINLYSGSLEETQRVIFNLLDFDFDGKIILEDSRLLISFIKNLANPPTGILKKLRHRSTISDEENFEEINILIKNFFENYDVMNFEEFKNQIENVNSDVFFLFIWFLYNNKPYQDSSIRVLKQSNKNNNNNNLNTSRNSFLNTSLDNISKNNNVSRIRTPTKVFKSFIIDLVDIDLEEIEKSCEDNQISEYDKSDNEDNNYLINEINENCNISKIPHFSAKINLENYKIDNDYIRYNTNNKKNLGSTIIKKSFKNYLERMEDFNFNSLHSKDNKFLNENDSNFNSLSRYNYDYTLNKKEINQEINSCKNTINTELNIQRNFKKKTYEMGTRDIITKTISGDELSENHKSEIKQILGADGTGGVPDRFDLSIKNTRKYGSYKNNVILNNKLNHNINKSYTVFNGFNNKFSKKNTNGEDFICPKIEILNQNNLIENTLTKNDFKKNRVSGMKLSIMSFETKENANLSMNNKLLNNSSGNVNKYLSPDSARLSVSGEILPSDIIFEGYIYRSDENNYLKKYYTALVGNDLFYFTNSKKTTLKGIHNLSGTYIFKDPDTIKVREYSSSKELNQNLNNISNKQDYNYYNGNASLISNPISEKKKIEETKEGKISNSNTNDIIINAKNNNIKTVFYYAFKLYFKKKCRVYYCSNEDDLNCWIENVRNITKFREITDYYQIGDDLGHGKFGKVKIVYPKKFSSNIISDFKLNEIDNLDEKLAIKIINKTNLRPIELELVKSEIEIMKFCRFRNIVRIIENFEDYENIFIILEYLSGGNLNNYLSAQKTILSEDKIKKLILQIASGISYLHHFGIIHRDLKPENIMMSDKSENPIVKIVDFGLSKVLGILQKSNESYGTLAYAAPEVIQKKDYNKTIDIWSLGVILYFLISGQFPFNDKNNNLHKIALEITSGEIKFHEKAWKRADEDSKDLVLKCLERDVNKRIDILNFMKHKWFKK